jgi:hypothetical protein
VRFVLDTNSCIHALELEGRVVEHLGGPHTIITVAEPGFGAHKERAPGRRSARDLDRSRFGGLAVVTHSSSASSWTRTTPPTHADNRSFVLFDRGDEVTVQASDRGIRFLLVSGRPLAEPVAWYGPIVMNTQAELRRAFEELRQGTFLGARGQR